MRGIVLLFLWSSIALFTSWNTFSVAFAQTVDDHLSEIGIGQTPNKLQDYATKLLKILHTPCTVRQAAIHSIRPIKDMEYIEVSCLENRGYIIFDYGDGYPGALDCITMQDGRGPHCLIDANKDLMREIKPFLNLSEPSCEPQKARAIKNYSSMKDYLFEVLCTNGEDDLMSVPKYMLFDTSLHDQSRKPEVVLCLENDDLCKYETHIEHVRNLKSLLQNQLSAQCSIVDGRYIGVSKRLDVFEIACKGGDNEIVAIDDQHILIETMPCSRSLEISVRCKLRSAE